MKMDRTEATGFAAAAGAVKRLWEKLLDLRDAYNRRMAAHYSAAAVATVATVACGVAAIFVLFVPRIVGVADDGSLTSILQSVGLSCRAEDAQQETGAYFVRLYSKSAVPAATGISTHRLLIRAAMLLDDWFTGDALFDVRFLAVLYLALYLPAVWLLVRQVTARVHYASEGTVVGAAAVLLLADVSYLSYFNSLYPEPVWLIGVVYSAGLCLSFQQPDKKRDPVRFALLMLVGSGLALCENHCAVLGFVLALFCLRQLGMRNADFVSRAMACLAAAVLIGAGMASLAAGSTRFTENSELNAMTSGVLLEADNPANALKEFGIDTRFETLADFSCYADYPYALSGNAELLTDFYPHTSVARRMLYYARHPAAMLALTELGVRAAFSLRREACGNYESTAGMPAHGQTLLFSAASNFKERSAPKTIGYLAVLAVVYVLLLSTRGARRMPGRSRSAALDTFAVLLAAGLAHTGLVVLYSGSAEFTRYSLVLSVCIDLTTLLTLAEGLHRMNLLKTEAGT